MVKAKHTVVNFLKTLNYGTYLIDLFVLLFLVVFIQLEENILSGIKTIVPEAFYIELFNEGSNIQLAGLMVALPSVLSIVVLVISIGKSNVLGTKIYKINSLRGPCCYSLLHFSILSVLMLATLTILSVFKLQMSLLYLDLAAAFISIYFLVQEIPLLSNSKVATRFIVRGIFRRTIKNIDKSNIDKGASKVLENNETFLQISAYLVFDLGIYKAVNFVLRRGCPNDQWRATRILIKAEETVLRSLTKGKRGTIFSEADPIGGIGYPVGKAFDGAAENLSAIIKTIGGFKGDNLITEGMKNLSDYVAKTIYGKDAMCLTNLLEIVELLYFKDDAAAKSKLQDAILDFNKLLKDEKFFYIPYQMAIYSLGNEDFWFIQKTILAESPLLLFWNYLPYLLFVTSLLCFLNDRRLLTPSGSKKLNDFVESRFSLPDGTSVCFKNVFIYMARSAVTDKSITSIDQMMKVLNCLQGNLAFFGTNRNSPAYFPEDMFGVSDIIEIWLETVLLICHMNKHAETFRKKLWTLANQSISYHLIIRNSLLQMLNENYRIFESDPYSLHRLLSLKMPPKLVKNDKNEKILNVVWDFISCGDSQLINSHAHHSFSGTNDTCAFISPLPAILNLEKTGSPVKKKTEICEMSLEAGQIRFNKILADKIRKIVQDSAKKIIHIKSPEEGAKQYADFYPCHGNYINRLPKYRLNEKISKGELKLSYELGDYLPSLTLFKEGAIQFSIKFVSNEIVAPKTSAENNGASSNVGRSHPSKISFKNEYYSEELGTFIFATPSEFEKAGNGNFRRVTLEISYYLEPDNYLILLNDFDSNRKA